MLGNQEIKRSQIKDNYSKINIIHITHINHCSSYPLIFHFTFFESIDLKINVCLQRSYFANYTSNSLAKHLKPGNCNYFTVIASSDSDN